MIEIKNITKIYNPGKSNEFTALKDISLTIGDGEMTAIIGKSGAGKSTLLHIMACIDNYQNGEYRIDGTLVKQLSERDSARIRNEKIGMVMQDFALVEDFSALENVLLPLDFAKNKKSDRRETAMKALSSVGMAEYAKKPVNKLSGGQKQRVAIARAIVNEPSMILADEPTGALDSRSSDELLALFAEINRRGQTILMVTHSAKAASRAKRVLFIKDGAVFHQLYRGNCSDDEFYRRITDALTLLSSSGEPQSLRIKREGAE